MQKQIDFIEIGNFITQIVNEVVTNYEMNYEKVGKFDKECQDILHSFELDNLSYSERNKLGTRLKDNRQERRRNKDIVDNYSSIYNFLNSFSNKKIVLQFASELKRYTRLKEKMGERKYVKRVRGGDVNV